MIVWGGGHSTPTIPIDTGGRYDPLTDSWTPTSTIGAPSPRRSHTAIWTGSEMIVWAGFDSSEVLDTGGRYDPASDTWTAIATAGAPAAGADDQSIWTGTEMIVWGPSGAGRYDPASDTWSPVSAQDAPAGLQGQIVVWNWNEMIVTGGLEVFEQENCCDDPPCSVTIRQTRLTGARYDPSTDTWMPGPRLNVESAVGVWTGAEMLFWGGNQKETLIEGNCIPIYMVFPQNGGGRYDPLQDLFGDPLSLDGAPSFLGHEGVWTGEQLIIWRGPTGGGRLTPGAFRSPDDDADGFTVCGGDCDDTDADIRPNAPETCDGIDTDCDGTPETDSDSDGFRVCEGDCDDANGGVFPGAPELCDGLDNDCDGSLPPDEADADADGFSICDGDCDDANGTVFPGAPEPCDGLDNDCDGLVDEAPPQVCSISPQLMNVRAGGSSLQVSLSSGCPGGSIDASSMPPAYISRIGALSLPDPATQACPGPGGDFTVETGIVENLSNRVVAGNDVNLKFNVETDGDCRTADGSRQVVHAVLSDTPNGSVVDVCVTSSHAGIPFTCCDVVTVRNTGNR